MEKLFYSKYNKLIEENKKNTIQLEFFILPKIERNFFLTKEDKKNLIKIINQYIIEDYERKTGNKAKLIYSKELSNIMN